MLEFNSQYWQQQQERINKQVEKLKQQPFTKIGRELPDPDNEYYLSIGEGRRLDASIMFIDISRFSSRPMANSVEQDLMLRILNLFFSEMICIAEDYNGQIEKNTGDGLMVYFADEEKLHSAQKAIECSLTMMSVTKFLINPIVRASNIEEIEFRISIDYGLITIAKIGFPRKFSSQVAIGDAANISSKMLKFAQANQIVIGEAVKDNLPINWQEKYIQLLTAESGWVYRATKKPYPLYLYNGRWNKLI